MIPRHQTVLFVLLLAASMAMAVVLWQLRERAHQHLISGENSTPTTAPEVAAAEEIALQVANDSDGSIVSRSYSLALPKDPGACAHAILGKLLDLYAASDSTHPVAGGANSVAQVFLMPISSETAVATTPAAAPGKAATATAAPAVQQAASQSISSDQTGPQLAVVNLTSGFASSHPSGIETETLTILSICQTLHANLPRVTQVRFLIDGQQRATLAGHADLTRTYLVSDSTPAQVTQP
jgi:hypothetical protein